MRRTRPLVEALSQTESLGLRDVERYHVYQS
jgi:hypothetical protein